MVIRVDAMFRDGALSQENEIISINFIQKPIYE